MRSSSTTNRIYKPSSKKEPEVPKFTKPSRRTLLRIRYYEFKIRVSDFGLQILRLLDRATFHTLTNNRPNIRNNEAKSVPSCDTACGVKAKAVSKSNDFINHDGSGTKGAMRDSNIQSDLEPGEIPTRKPKFKGRGRSRERKRRSSLTRRKNQAERERSTSIRSSIVGSGDINFTESETDTGERTKLELKRNRRRSRKSKKLLKECEAIEETGVNSSLEKEKESIEPKPTQPSNPSNDLPPLASPSKFQIQLEKAYEDGESKAKAPKKSFWEKLQALSHSKRSQRSLDRTQKVFQVGFKMGLPTGGNIRGRESIRNLPMTPPAHPKDHLGLSIYNKPFPTVYFGIRRSSTTTTLSPQSHSQHESSTNNLNYGSKYLNLPTVDKSQEIPPFIPSPPSPSTIIPERPPLLNNTQLSPPLLHFPQSPTSLPGSPTTFIATTKKPPGLGATADTPLIPKTFDIIESILSRIPITHQIPQRETTSFNHFRDLQHSLSTPSRFSSSLQQQQQLGKREEDGADSKPYRPQTAFTAQFYKLLNQNPLE